jgi:hypothetical protein
LHQCVTQVAKFTTFSILIDPIAYELLLAQHVLQNKNIYNKEVLFHYRLDNRTLCMKNIYIITLIIGLTTAITVGNAQTTTVRINEFMALNQSGITDEDGEYSDWIELYNPTAEAINLQGYTISDQISYPKNWVFPSIVIEANDYLVIFASGKDRGNPANNLHTNFKLSGSGEYLALYKPDGTAVSSFNPSFPAQTNNVSYGYFQGGYMSFTYPTPGTDNATSASIQLPMPKASTKHGFFDAAFALTVTCDISNASIYYTLDGSLPSATNGLKYTEPLNIAKTTVFRAISEIPGSVSSKVTTQTYLFVNDIIHQPNNPTGYPDQWGPYAQIQGTAIADYEMDPEVINASGMAQRVKDGLKALPVVSLVTDKNHFFNRVDDPVTGGIYIYTGPPTGGSGKGWERPVSFEYFDAKESVSLQADCAIELHGGHSRLAEKNPKHSMRITFKDEYGPSKLKFPFFGPDAAQSFNALIFRGGFGNSWTHWTQSQRLKGTLTQDPWTKLTQKEMGQLASNENFAHLFINGLYWGIYTPSEKMDAVFGESYMDGSVLDYDVIKDYTEVADGNIDAWNAMMALVRTDMTNDANYQQIQGNNPDGTPNPAYPAYLDVENLADYMLINFFGANADWDHHNWVAIRNRVNPGKGFKFICWDNELLLDRLNDNILAEKNNNCPSEIFQSVVKNDNFKRLLANRIQKHCFDGGTLTPASNTARWNKLADMIDKAIDAESARWGDYRRDVHPYSTKAPEIFTRDNQYMAVQTFLTGTYFPQRTSVFVNHLKNAGWFPSVSAPLFKVNNVPFNGGNVPANSQLSMSATQGTVYFTTDGSDPVTWTGSTGTLSPSAISYTYPITVANSMRIKARTYYNGNWSAINDKFLVIATDFNNLKFTEVHYNPLPDENDNGSDYEFLEIKNTGNGYLNIGDMAISEGVYYKFPIETELKPGAFIVLASKSNAFKQRYGFAPFDDYSGNLNNDGEYIRMETSNKTTISYFRFNDGVDWPQTPDGEGHSLVPTELNPTNDQNSPLYWRASYRSGGSPGADDLPVSSTNAIPRENGVVLSQNYPNPIQTNTFIDFQLPYDAKVRLDVLDMYGKTISTPYSADTPAGLHQVEWHADNVKPGIYLYRLTVNGNEGTAVLTKRMLVK